MQTMWFIVFLLSLFITFLLKSLLFKPSNKLDGGVILPPGPSSIPIIGSFIWLYKLSHDGIKPILAHLHTKHGPIVSLPMPFTSQPAFYINDCSLAHQVLVQNSAVTSDRGPPTPIIKVISNNKRIIFCCGYGPTWRLLRRSLMSDVLNPSRINADALSRKWALNKLTNRLDMSISSNGGVLGVLEHFRFSITSLFVYMAFGVKVDDEAKMDEIIHVQRRFLFGLVKGFHTLNLGPRWLNKILFRKGWNDFYDIREQQKKLLLPFIQARKKVKQERVDKDKDSMIPYIDSLLNLKDPNENREFNDRELIDQSSELVNSGTDTMSITLQWIMANIVKYPHVQKRLVEEIKEVSEAKNNGLIKDDDIRKMPYLKAVVMETLRLHPPGHLLIPHLVTKDIVLDGKYKVPENSTVNFMVAEMGRDPSAWGEEALKFKPERFMTDGGNVECDITGSKEIKMMPFGAGRRICPGWSLSMLLLEYFVANLVWKYEWDVVEGVGVDLTDKQDVTWAMKNPLQAHISPRN